MRKVRIILVRHGQTEHNAQKLMQGSGVNSRLNQVGKSEALKLAQSNVLAQFQPATIYASPLERALETAEIALGRQREGFVLDERLVERSFGAQYEGKPYTRATISRLVQMSEAECEEAGIETEEHVRQRCLGFLCALKKANDDR